VLDHLAVVFLFSALAIAAALAAVALRRRRRRLTEFELEALRDEIWELRAAAAARDKAEAASLAKSRFLATVSHEIRTPLNGILGLAQLLAMTRLDAEQASYVEAMGASARSLAQLIDDILDFSKIEAGKLELRSEIFALAPLVEGVVELLAPRAQGKSLEIASFISPDAPRDVVGDPARLRQVLVNLVGNAVAFTEKGGVCLSVGFDAEDRLRFAVEDTGPGIAPTVQEAIFEEFEQGDPSASRRHGGTGLGLAISRRLVTSMGGALGIDKSSSAGTTFVFTLPVDPTRAAPPPPAPVLAGLDALIVAQSRFEAPVLARSLTAAGASAQIAPGEAAGLAALERAAGAVVIVDCALGAAAIERLAEAARARGAEQLFLLFSPLERRAFGEAALARFDGWLVKPVRAASLIARLTREAPGAPKAAATAEPEPVLDGVRILVAEDNDINALIVTRHLAKLGAAVTRAENGLLAVERASAAAQGRSDGYDVILMDLFMPELDGLEATRRIRIAENRSGVRRTPILALTASALEEDARAAREAGVDAILTKPVEFSTLRREIERLRHAPPVPVERRLAALREG